MDTSEINPEIDPALAAECAEAVEGIEKLAEEVKAVEEDPATNKAELQKLGKRMEMLIYGVGVLGITAFVLGVTHQQKFEEISKVAQNFINNNAGLVAIGTIGGFAAFLVGLRKEIKETWLEFSEKRKNKT